MPETSQRFIEANGLRLHITEQGSGPLVILCHGFPESWYSWRHQLRDLAEAGFRVVAPDMRGYGRSEQPIEVERYTLLHLVGDMVGLLDALGETHAVIAGHDWGAPVAWHAALLRPDRFRGVIGLSVPYRPRGTVSPTSVMPRTDEALFYQLYFQSPAAEVELDADPRASLAKILYSASGEGTKLARAADGAHPAMVRRSEGLLTRMVEPDPLPEWLTETDLDFYAEEFAAKGFRGGLNWYRNLDRNWELLAPFAGARITVPALFIAGDRDLVVSFRGMQQSIADLSTFVPQLRGTLMLPGCGHWTQQERPREVSEAMIRFLREFSQIHGVI
jgi:pimeloyl-ACP methyl ester carboxylesterase